MLMGFSLGLVSYALSKYLASMMGDTPNPIIYPNLYPFSNSPNFLTDLTLMKFVVCTEFECHFGFTTS